MTTSDFEFQRELEIQRKRTGYMFRRHLMCCTSGPLVYVRNLKCGSTFFWKNLKETFKWKEIAWENIDWKTQRVFGHIMDPWKRRIKGMAEYLHMTDMADEFHSNPKFQQFLLSIIALDIHSSSYHDQFGNLAWHIDWIPIQGHDHLNVIHITDLLLEHYGIFTLDRWNFQWKHPSDNNKLQTEQKLKELFDQQTLSEPIRWYLHNDVQLWNTVVEKHNRQANSWPEISWLDQPTTTP